jgi:23S rRNA (adenine2503-C2)-methyltransferase
VAPTVRDPVASALRRATLPDGRIDASSLDRATLEHAMVPLGRPAHHARQVFKRLWQRGMTDFDECAEVTRASRGWLAEHLAIQPLDRHARLDSDDGTTKYLWRLADGSTIESVLIPDEDRPGPNPPRYTLCVSTQVGCAMACSFCLTGDLGLKRNLTAGEIARQVLQVQQDMPAGRRVTNVVLMGMGEPLHNYDNVWRALHRLTDNETFGLGARHITLSTVGLVNQIDRMADEELQIGLAVSLHAPNDDVRGSLVPVNRRWHVDDVLDAVRRYVAKTNRRVTFEYALMRGINDTPEQAHELGGKLADILCHVNVIPLNPIPDSPYQPASDEDTARFVAILQEHGVPATVRLRRGIEINAGCGQLRRSVQQN